MKKIIFPALVGILILSSCKKDYTCECTETEIDSDGVSVSSTYKYTIKNTNKKTVAYSGACESYESFDKDGKVDYKQECTLKKN